MPKFRKKDAIGILFDPTGFNRAQWGAIADMFGDCERGDYEDLIRFPDDADGGESTFREGAIPFVLWSPDALFDDREALARKLARNATARTRAFTGSYGESPQYQTMWFLHADGHVTFADIDGTFDLRKKPPYLSAHPRVLLPHLVNAGAVLVAFDARSRGDTALDVIEHYRWNGFDLAFRPLEVRFTDVADGHCIESFVPADARTCDLLARRMTQASLR